MLIYFMVNLMYVILPMFIDIDYITRKGKISFFWDLNKKYILFIYFYKSGKKSKNPNLYNNFNYDKMLKSL